VSRRKRLFCWAPENREEIGSLLVDRLSRFNLDSMRLSSESIKALQALLSELHGLELTDEQAQEAGIAIMRFTFAKAHKQQELTNNMEVSTNG